MRVTTTNNATLLICGLVLLAGCSKEVPPRSVSELVENPIILESVMVRCAQNRAETRYDAECVNARQAVSLIEAREERARRDALESQSERKRAALNRTQKAAAEARRRAAEAEARRKEAEYLAQFGEPPPAANSEYTEAPNAPGAVVPEPVAEDPLPERNVVQPPASDGGNAPVMQTEPESNLDAVRDELRRRSEESSD